MWKCGACKDMHADFRERCPVFGTPKPSQPVYERRPKDEPRYGWCAECGKGMHVEPSECPICDERVCRRCAKRHITACEEHAFRAEMADYADYLDMARGVGLYAPPLAQAEPVSFDPADLESIAYACITVYDRAVKDLGPGLMGHSVTDLLADNLPGLTLERIREAARLAGLPGIPA